jgi:hypothetical protein
MAYHHEKTGADVHVPYAWTYADAAARTGATGFVAGDVGKLARQTDTNTLWMLTATTPTWVQIGGAGVTGTITTEEGDVVESATTGTIDFDDSDFNVSVSPAGEANVSLNYGSGAGQPAEGNHAHAGVVTGVSIPVGNGTDVLATTEPETVVVVPFAATITGASLDADQSGDLEVEWERAAAGTPTTFVSLTAAAPPTLTGAQSVTDTTLAGWTTGLAAGDRLRLTVTGTPATITRATASLTLTRSV